MIGVHDLTCVIPTHRRPELLAEALESVLAQIEPVAEVIVVADVPDPAGRLATMSADAGTPTRVRFIDRSSEHRPGASRSRNVGASVATT